MMSVGISYLFQYIDRYLYNAEMFPSRRLLVFRFTDIDYLVGTCLIVILLILIGFGTLFLLTQVHFHH